VSRAAGGREGAGRGSLSGVRGGAVRGRGAGARRHAVRAAALVALRAVDGPKLLGQLLVGLSELFWWNRLLRILGWGASPLLCLSVVLQEQTFISEKSGTEVSFPSKGLGESCDTSYLSSSRI